MQILSQETVETNKGEHMMVVKDASEQLIQDRIKELRENTDFVDALLESLIGYAIIAADFDGNVIAFNEGARQIYGYTPEEVIGKQSIEIFLPKEFIKEGAVHKCSTLDQVWWISGPDDVIAEITADPRVTLIMINEADLLGRAWQGEREQKITDAQAVLDMILNLPDNRVLDTVNQIRAQGFGGTEMETPGNSKIIDPEDPTPGINRPKEFNISDYVNEEEFNEQTS